MKIKKNVMKAVKQGAIKAAINSISQTCVWWCYQPKAPANLKKLKIK